MIYSGIRNTSWVSRSMLCFWSFPLSPHDLPWVPWGIYHPTLYIIHNESSLVSFFGWYSSSMTLTSLSSLSSSQLVDSRPKFITTFHSPPLAYLIYDSINNKRCRMPCRPRCLAHSRFAQITTRHSQAIKTVFTYQLLWGRHSAFKTDAQREGKEWPSHSLQSWKFVLPKRFFYFVGYVY